MRFRHRVIASTAFASVAWLSSQPGRAAAIADPQQLQEVVVTAQRREQRLQDVPVAVSIVTGRALQAANILTLEDVSQRLPNIKITDGALTPQLNVRGVGSGINNGFEQSVAVFVDDIYRSRAKATRAALFDLDQLELLKGPQSTFFGANAIAGALNITTRKPGKDFDYNASALYGQYGEYNIEGGVDLPVSNTLSLRLAARASGMDGYVDVGALGHGPADDSLLGRIAIRWEPISELRSDLRIDAGRSRTGNAFPFELLNCPPPAPFPTAGSTCGRYIALNGGAVDDRLNYHSASPYSFANYDFYEAAWTNSLQLGDGTLTSTTGFFHHTYEARFHQVPMPIVDVVDGYDPFPAVQEEKYHQFSQELRYQSPAGRSLEYMIGVYFASSRLDALQYSGLYYLPFGGFPSASATGTNATTPITAGQGLFEDDTTVSGFGALTIRPFTRFRLNLGGRYTSVSKEAHRNGRFVFGTAVNADPATFVLLPGASQDALTALVGLDPFDFPHPKRTDTKFMPSVGVQYDLTDRVMTYATFSTGFKAGGYSSAARALDFDPETVKNYEVGVKSKVFGGRAIINADLFRGDYSNLQETAIVSGPNGINVSVINNAAASRSQGVELGASFRLVPDVSLSSDLAYLDSKYLDYPNGACTIEGNLTSGCVQDMSGKRRAFSPQWSGNVALDVVVPFSGYEFIAQPSVYFSSSYFELSTADPLLKQDGYAKLDLRLAVRSPSQGWEIALIGKNLTDQTTSGFRALVTGAPGSVFALTDPPRSFAVQLSVRR
jgi:outer membrane receptor protein involved in Fe transport